MLTANGDAEQLGFQFQRVLKNDLTDAPLGKAMAQLAFMPAGRSPLRHLHFEAQAANAGAVTRAARARSSKLKDIDHGQHHGQR
ncbi:MULTISPECIES: hypothetical protein [Sphingomonas]|uniref:hypothetical protein n=1 Tax=Sphingomonas TaxID=13687 RepID=UPI00105051D8|nr:hypothetical protein [Sphingomonas sp. PP-F2F-A104-K0414]